MFDNFELYKVAEFNDNHGGTFCEMIIDSEQQKFADEEAIRQFWTIYGHYPHPTEKEAGQGVNAGLEALIDMDNEKEITRIYLFLLKLLRAYNTLNMIQKSIKELLHV